MLLDMSYCECFVNVHAETKVDSNDGIQLDAMMSVVPDHSATFNGLKKIANGAFSGGRMLW